MLFSTLFLMDNEREIEFDYIGFCMGTRCMQRARDGIPHNYKRQVAWATNTLTTGSTEMVHHLKSKEIETFHHGENVSVTD